MKDLCQCFVFSFSVKRTTDIFQLKMLKAQLSIPERNDRPSSLLSCDKNARHAANTCRRRGIVGVVPRVVDDVDAADASCDHSLEPGGELCGSPAVAVLEGVDEDRGFAGVLRWDVVLGNGRGICAWVAFVSDVFEASTRS